MTPELLDLFMKKEIAKELFDDAYDRRAIVRKSADATVGDKIAADLEVDRTQRQSIKAEQAYDSAIKAHNNAA